MKLDCLVNEAGNLGATVTDCYAARNIRDIRAEAGTTLFNDHEILQRRPTFFRPARFRTLFRGASPEPDKRTTANSLDCGGFRAGPVA